MMEEEPTCPGPECVGQARGLATVERIDETENGFEVRALSEEADDELSTGPQDLSGQQDEVLNEGREFHVEDLVA